jgi:hypothetical protein
MSATKVANCDLEPSIDLKEQFANCMSDKEVSLKIIEDKIYLMRGERVMLDSDLANLYQVETGALNRAVKRNLGRFPSDFVFQLVDDEVESLRCQFGISNKGRGGRRYLPYVFTEHGAVMLATILNSQTAVEASILVVRAFVQMRSIMGLHQDLADRVAELENVTYEHDEKFGVVSQLLSEILHDPKYLKRNIGFVETENLRLGKPVVKKKT